MNETFRLLLSLSVSGSILAAFILAIKPLIRHKLSKSIQYYLWIVVLLRLILPFSFEESMMNQVFYGDQPAQITTGLQGEANTYQLLALPHIQENVIKNVSNGTYNNDADHGGYFNDLFNQSIFYLWLLGVIIALTVNLTGYTRFARYLKKANRPAADEESRILTTLLNGRKNVRLVRNPLVATPMLIGILRPLIIIPDINLSGKQLKNILLHELVHLKCFDIGIKWLTMIAASLHWFNPLMYFIKREINHACELSCDEAVIKNLNAEEKQAYGDTLISVATENKYPPGVLQVTMSEEKATLKERLVAIMKYTKKSKAIMLMSAVLLVTVIGGAVMLGGCSGKTNSEDTNTDILTPSLTANTKIENLLAQIMSSPRESSNPFDYIAAHQEEYDAIIKMDVEALPYLFSEFERGGQTGLKGHIMESLCRRILGGEDIKYANTDPQDWYDHYKAFIRTMLEKNSLQFLKEHIPKGSLVLNHVDVVRDFLEQKDLKVVVNSRANENIQLPSNFEYVKDGVNVGKLLKQRNELSKQHNLDFSKYMGQKVEMHTAAIETGDPDTYYDVVLFVAEKKVVGFWVDAGMKDPKQNSPDFNVLVNLLISRIVPDKEIGSEKLLSFIKNYDGKTRMLTFDEIEWVKQEDTERVNALGLDADLDFPDGYYIHNESIFPLTTGANLR